MSKMSTSTVDKTPFPGPKGQRGGPSFEGGASGRTTTGTNPHRTNPLSGSSHPGSNRGSGGAQPISREFAFQSLVIPNPHQEIRRRVESGSPTRGVMPSSGRGPPSGRPSSERADQDHAFAGYRVPGRNIRAAAQVHTARPEKVPMLNLVRQTKHDFAPDAVLALAARGKTGMLRYNDTTDVDDRCCGRACDFWFSGLLDDGHDNTPAVYHLYGGAQFDSSLPPNPPPPISVHFPAHAVVSLQGYLDQVLRGTVLPKYLVLLQDGRLFQFRSQQEYRNQQLAASEESKAMLLATGNGGNGSAMSFTPSGRVSGGGRNFVQAAAGKNGGLASAAGQQSGANGGKGGASNGYGSQDSNDCVNLAEAIYPFAPLGNCRAVRGKMRDTIEFLDWRGLVIGIFQTSSTTGESARGAPSADAWLYSLAEYDREVF